MEDIVGQILIAFFGMAAGVIPAYLAFKIKMKSRVEQAVRKGHANSVLDRWLHLRHLGIIKQAVESIFRNTTADRFLILISYNGASPFRYVSAIYEEHRLAGYEISAVHRYKMILLDGPYNEMLKQAERSGPVHLKTETMPPSMLRDFYEMEGVKHSVIRFLMRWPVDDENDVVVFSSIASHGQHPFNHLEETYFKIAYESVVLPTLQRIMNPENQMEYEKHS